MRLLQRLFGRRRNPHLDIVARDLAELTARQLEESMKKVEALREACMSPDTRKALANIQLQFDVLRRDQLKLLRSLGSLQTTRAFTAVECLLAAIMMGLVARDQPNLSNVKWAAAALLATTILRIIRDK